MINAKKLQDFMVDSKIPRAWRDRVPLVVSPKGIAWVVGWRPSNWARAKDNNRDNLMLSFAYEN
jgi:tRNA(Ile)-lysidine synthase